MPEIVPYAAGLVGLLLALRYGGAVWRVLSLRLRADPEYARAGAEDVPPPLRALLEAQAQELEALGFEAAGWLREAFPIAGVDEPVFSRVLHHPASAAFALLAIAEAPSRSRPCDVVFLSLAEDGRKLATLAFAPLHAWVGLAKHTQVDARTLSYTEQWQRHQDALAAQEEFVARDASLDELVAECADSARRANEHMLEAGGYARTADGQLRFRARAALGIVLRSTRAAREKTRAVAALEKQRPLEASPGDVEAEQLAHRRRDAIEHSRQTGWLGKLALFVASVVAFAFAFGLQMSAANVALLFAVLLFHELGHALAMKAFGYRDLQVLFIPFLGAVASGRKRETKPHEEIVVLLAGPVPGILLGSALLVWGGPERAAWLGDAAVLLLIVNYLNLLPIMPLDGGRIMNLVLFDRFPTLQLVFSALSALAVLAAGAWSDDGVLRAFGLFLAIALPVQWKQTRLLGAVRARLAAPEPAATPLAAIYTELRQPRFDAWNVETRYQAASQLLARLSRPMAGAGLACLSVAGWLLIMTVPLGLVVYGQISAGLAAVAEAEAAYQRERAEWLARQEQATAPVEQARAHLGAAELALRSAHYADAAAELAAAGARLEPLYEPALESTVELRLAELARAWPEDEAEDATRARAARHLDRALDLRERAFGPETLEVAEVLESFPFEPEPSRDSDRAAALVRQLRLIAIYERAPAREPVHIWSLVRAYEHASLLRAHAQDLERAEAALRRALAAAEAAGEGERASLERVALDALSSFYLAQGRPADARALLARRVASAADPDEQDELALAPEVDRCWIAYWESDYASARTCFEQRAAPDSVGTLPYLLDAALAAERAGDAAGAKARLADARAIAARELGGMGLDEYAQSLLEPGDGPDFDWAGREWRRRAAERARVLAPLLAAL